MCIHRAANAALDDAAGFYRDASQLRSNPVLLGERLWRGYANYALADLETVRTAPMLRPS